MLCMIMLAGVAGTLVPATAVAASAQAKPSRQRFGVRLLDVPVSEAHNPRGLRYIIDFLRPGTVIHRRILVMNSEARRARFGVYPDAARITHGFFIGDAGHKRSELTGWVTVRHPQVSLAAGRSATDMVTIRIPKVATRGEHYGVIWVQRVSRVRGSQGFFVKEIARVGIRIYLAVGRGGAPPTRLAITSITGTRTPKGVPVLTAHVRDTGGRAVDLNGTARLLDGPGNTSAGPLRARQVLTLAPGQSGAETFVPRKRLPDRPWRAVVTMTSGLTTRKASATILFSRHHVSGLLSPTGMIWTGSGLMLALLVAIAVMVRRGRRPRRAHARPFPLFRTRTD